ncbi:MAG: sugar ABC transporter ATP-binding protein [Alphaproteobacteria bacterium]|nr:sugar ABC transporter ATP-binding protein [Alphaproteobacteria bacterium]
MDRRGQREKVTNTSVPAAPPPVVALDGVSFNYGAVEALKRITLAVAAGEVLGLCGDNGAGKSTLIKVISGAERPSRGRLLIDGAPANFIGPREALTRGIATIYQNLALAPTLSIAENVFMGAELTRASGVPGLKLLDKRAMRRAAADYLEQLNIDMPAMTTPVAELSGGQRQAVAIARALRWQARVIVMDEPTAALGVKETQRVLDLIRTLAATGRTVLLVSHNMADIVAVTTRVIILHSGAMVLDRPTHGLSADALAHLVMTAGTA